MRRLGGVVIIVGNILFGRITVQFVREVLGRLTVVIQEQLGGTNRFSNLVPSCITCNREKGVQTSRQFGSLRLRAEDLSKGRRVKKLGKNLTPNDFIRMAPADRAFYRKEIRAFR